MLSLLFVDQTQGHLASLMRVYFLLFLTELPVEISLVCLNVYVHHLLVYVNIPYISGTHGLVFGGSLSWRDGPRRVECQAYPRVC